MKILYGFFAAGMFVFAIMLFKIYNPDISPAILALPIMLLSGSVLTAINLVKRKIIIDDQGIISISVFIRKEIALSDIKGYRLNGKSLLIKSLLDNGPTIRSNYTDFGHSGELSKWLKDNFKDLDALDLETGRKEALENTAFGNTNEGRTATLARARNIAIVYNGAGLLLGFIVLIYDKRPGIIMLMIYPLISLLIMAFSKGSVKFFSDRKRSVLAFVFLGVAMPCFVLLVTALNNYDLLRVGPLWRPALIVSAILFSLLYVTGFNTSIKSPMAQVLIMAIPALLYGFGSILQLNCAFDDSRPKIYNAAILDQRESHGKRTSYYLTLGPWGPRDKTKEVEIHSYLYHYVQVGDTVQTNLKDGVLHIPWFFVSKREATLIRPINWSPPPLNSSPPPPVQ